MNRILFLLTFLIFTSTILSAQDGKFTITIDRNMTCSDQSTIGRLLVEGNEIGRTLELPWRNNESNISRIPEGIYSARIRSDGERRWRIELQDVQDRQWVQIHVGNYPKQIEGCILVGSEVTNHDGSCMVPNSRATLDRMANEMAKFSASLSKNQSSPISISVQIN